MKEIVFTRRFERDFRRLKKRLRPHVLDYETLEYVFELLQRGKPLPTRSRIVFHRTGTHRELFRPRSKQRQK